MCDEIITPRLRLRPARPDDLEAMHAVLSDPVAMRYWSSLPHAGLDETREWLDRMIGDTGRTGRDFVVEEQGEVIGKAGCYQLPEIGFILRRDRWGLGLAREALAAIIPHLFERFPIPALTADVDPRNAASLGLLLRMGFVETGRAKRTWLIGDEHCDSIYLALQRADAPESLRGHDRNG